MRASNERYIWGEGERAQAKQPAPIGLFMSKCGAVSIQ